MDSTLTLDATEAVGRRLLSNAGLIVVSRLAGILTLLVSVPFIMNNLGADGFGVWESLLGVAGMAMIFQSIVSGTILWQIARCYATGAHEETRRLVRTGIGATLLLIVVFLSTAWATRHWVCEALHVPREFALDAKWLLPSIVGLMLLGGINESLAAVVSGYQRAGWASLVQSVGLIVTNVVAIVALAGGGGLSSLLIGYLCGFCVQFVALYPLASSCCGRLSLVPLLPTSVVIRKLGPFAGLLLLSNLTLIFRDHSDRLILSSLGSPELTGYFGIAQRLSSLVMQACVVFYTPFTAALSALHSRADWSGVCQLYGRVAGWIGALAGLAVFLICTLHKPIIVFWVGADLPQVHTFLALLTIGSGSAAILTGAGVALCKAIGRPGLETAYLTLTLFATLLSKPLLIAYHGAIGSVLSSAGSWCLGAMFFVVLLHRQVQLSSVSLLRSSGIFLVTICAAIVGWCAGSFIDEPGTRFAAAGWLTGLGAVLAIAYLIVLYRLRLVEFGAIERRSNGQVPRDWRIDFRNPIQPKAT